MVRTRKELIEHYTSLLSGYYSEFVEETRTKAPWLKTQLLEVDVHGQDVDSQLQSIFQTFAAQADGFSFERLDEDFFYCLRRAQDETENVYIDALDNRFLVLYSSMRRDPFDVVIDGLTKKPHIDRAWFPQDFMITLDQLGGFRGYGGRFNNEFFVQDAEQPLDDNPNFRNLSFKSWGNTQRLLTLIRGDTELKDEFSLTNMRIKVAYDIHDDTDTVIDDVTYSGRITSLGRSFRAHNEALIKIRDSYRSLVVNTIEENFGLHYTDNSLKGSPIVFTFTKEIENLADFTNRLFSGKKPFKLWGLETVSKERFVRVEVLDLHVKNRLMVDVYPNHIKVAIRQGVCGNTILRLLTLLQQSLNSSVQLVNQDGEVLELGMTRNG